MSGAVPPSPVHCRRRVPSARTANRSFLFPEEVRCEPLDLKADRWASNQSFASRRLTAGFAESHHFLLRRDSSSRPPCFVARHSLRGRFRKCRPVTISSTHPGMPVTYVTPGTANGSRYANSLELLLTGGNGVRATAKDVLTNAVVSERVWQEETCGRRFCGDT